METQSAFPPKDLGKTGILAFKKAHPDPRYMWEAIRFARMGRDSGDYAFGAIIVDGAGHIISAADNRAKRDENPTAHAETRAVLKATELRGNRHLADCVLYSTHEPCPMCASVAIWAKLQGVVYGALIEDIAAYRKAKGESEYLWRTIHIPCKEMFARSNEPTEVVDGFMREECVKLFHS